MQVEARMADQPSFDHRGLMGSVIVEDQVDVEMSGDFGVDELQELLELDGPMPMVDRADHLSGGHVQGCEETGGAMADIVVAAPLGRAGHERQDRLRPIQSL